MPVTNDLANATESTTTTDCASDVVTKNGSGVKLKESLSLQKFPKIDSSSSLNKLRITSAIMKPSLSMTSLPASNPGHFCGPGSPTTLPRTLTNNATSAGHHQLDNNTELIHARLRIDRPYHSLKVGGTINLRIFVCFYADFIQRWRRHLFLIN